MIYLLDTNALTALVRGHPAVRAKAFALRSAEVVVSSIVTHEYCYGAFYGTRTQDTLRRLDELQLRCLDFTADDARKAGEIRAALRARGTPIGPYDVLIAGQALARGLVLVTHNVGEFSRVEGLVVEDWEG